MTGADEIRQLFAEQLKRMIADEKHKNTLSDERPRERVVAKDPDGLWSVDGKKGGSR